MSFFKKYLGIKTDRVKDLGMELIVSGDTEDALKADIAVAQDFYKKCLTDVEESRIEFDKEQQDVVDILAKQDNMLAGIDILSADLDAALEANNLGEAEAIEADVLASVADLENMQADIEREKQEAEDAKGYMADLESDAEEARQDMLALENAAKTAKRDLDAAQKAKERADRQQDKQAIRAGRKNKISKSAAALTALQKKTDQLEKEAKVTEGLTKALAPEKQSDRLQKAMARAKAGSAPAASVQDRLAALKAKKTAK